MKALQRWRTALACALVLLLLGHTLRWWELPGLGRLERVLQDRRIAWIAPAAPEDRVVIVDIDEASLREPEQGGEGRWPWPRDRLALLIERLFQDHGAAVIGLDIILSGRHEQDARLAQAMSLGPVVVGDAFHTGGGSSGDPPAGLDPTPWSSAHIRIRSHDQVIGVVQTLRAAAAGSGHLHPLRDEDGVTRRVPLFIEHQGRWHPALVLSVLQAWSDAPPPQPVMVAYGQGRRIESVAVAGLQVPVDDTLQALVPYRAAAHPLPSVSAADVIRGRVAPGPLQGRIVLVGTSATGLADLVTTPVQASLPGVQVHGQLLAGLLDERVPHQPAWAQAAEGLIVVVAGLLIALWGGRLQPVALAAAGAGVLVLLVASNLMVLNGPLLMLPLATPLMAVCMPLAFHMAWGYGLEARSRRQMAELFSHYVPPEIVQRMAANPAAYDMKPQERELTVLFADVRGFTSVSEGLSPQELSDWINEYLTAMSTAIRDVHHGTLDKYIGDAVMAFWGAPMDESAHAARAVAAALEMQRRARVLSASFCARGWPPLAIGVGLNTGLMRVGDMGSAVRRAYTVMGDAVNLGSRLEGLTRTYGVDVLIGPNTRAQLPGWICCEVDRVRVKGKQEPVAIFEPLGPQEKVSQAQQEKVARWHEALQACRDRQWPLARQRLLALQAQDPHRALWALYLQRLERWEQDPPGPDWDGVTTFETK